MENKLVFAIGRFGEVSFAESENITEIHDDIVYRMFKEFIDSLLKDEKDKIESICKLDELEGTFFKNMIYVSVSLEIFFVLEKDDRDVFLMPPNPSIHQREYFLNNYYDNDKRSILFYFEDGFKEMFSEDIQVGHKNIVEKINELTFNKNEEKNMSIKR